MAYPILTLTRAPRLLPECAGHWEGVLVVFFYRSAPGHILSLSLRTRSRSCSNSCAPAESSETLRTPGAILQSGLLLSWWLKHTSLTYISFSFLPSLFSVSFFYLLFLRCWFFPFFFSHLSSCWFFRFSFLIFCFFLCIFFFIFVVVIFFVYLFLFCYYFFGSSFLILF